VTGTFHLPQFTAVLAAVWKFKAHPSQPNLAENTTGLSLLNSGHFKSGHKSSGADVLFFIAIFFFPFLQCNVLRHLRHRIKCRYLSPTLVLLLDIMSIFLHSDLHMKTVYLQVSKISGFCMTSKCRLGHKGLIPAPKCACCQWDHGRWIQPASCCFYTYKHTSSCWY